MQVLQDIKLHNHIQLLQTLIVFKYCNKKVLTKEGVDIIKLKKTYIISFIST
jgi:hypothetical protein